MAKAEGSQNAQCDGAQFENQACGKWIWTHENTQVNTSRPSQGADAPFELFS
jgi:hypothetical protein